MKHSTNIQLKVVFALIVFMVISCRSTTQEDPGETEDDQLCSACTEQYCKDAIASCSANLSCRERQSCIDECQLSGASTSECDEHCLGNEIFYNFYTDVSLCQATHCSAACERHCGGFLYRLDGCGECVQSQCCESATACGDDPDCYHAILCRSGCATGDWACYRDCSPKADAEILSRQYEQCIGTKCVRDCGLGTAWSCVGQEKTIEYNRREVTLSWQFSSILSSPVEGVSIKMCNWADIDCDNPLVEGQSGADGMAVLTYNIEPASIINPTFFKATKQGYLDEIVLYSARLSDSPGVIRATMMTPEDLQAFALLVSTDVAPNRGHLFVSLLDCAMHSAPGLSVVLPEISEAKPFFTRDLLPDLAANDSGWEGQAGFFNLPPGSVSLQVHLAEDETSPLMKTSVPIRANVITQLILWPK